MKKDMKKNKRNFGLAFAIAGAVAGVAATTIAVLKQKKREQVYHEAEMKAMDELDNLNAENENVCAGCDCLDDCAVAGGSCCGDQAQVELKPVEAEEADALPQDTVEQPEVDHHTAAEKPAE